MSSMSTLYLEIGIVLVAIFAILVGLYMFNRYMKRRGPEMAQREGKAVLDDRSFNQIRLAQSAADHLSRTGVDVSEAKALLARAETARVGGNYDLSIELAKKAQDSLAAARAAGNPLVSPSPVKTSPSPGAIGKSMAPTVSGASTSSGYTAPPSAPFFAAGDAAVPEPTGSSEPMPDRPPKNKMEAHFQLELAHDELDQARSAKSRTRLFREAEGFWTNGQAAYDKQDFTEALRLALKSRRTLGTKVEALPVTATAPPSSSGDPAVAGRDPGALVDQPTFGQKCAKCGRTAAPTDQFCRGCGTAIPPALCSSCGAPLLQGDRFCGKCGATQT